MKMETRDTQTISLRVTAEELTDLDTRAAGAGISRPDYIRARLFAPDHSARISQLEQQLNALTDQLGQVDPEEPEENRKCSNPEHAKVYGVGHCFICDLPIKSAH
jgi:hypothetical protein